jgi:hypothetical protein
MVPLPPRVDARRPLPSWGEAIQGAGILRCALNDTKYWNEARASHIAVDPWLGGASAGVEKDPGSLGFARDDTKEEGDEKKNLRAKGRPRHFAIFLTLGAGVTPAAEA